jgi:single-stranded DNA-binding protein
VTDVRLMQNQVFLLGRLCHAPHFFLATSGQPKLAFRLAVPRSPSTTCAGPCDRRDDRHLDYATVILFGKKARELYAQRFARGAWVSVVGRLQTWKSGQWEIVAQCVEPARMDNF